MIEPTQKAVETSRGGKPKGEEPTDLEIAFRAVIGAKDDLNEMTGALVLARQQTQSVVEQQTPGANATVRRMVDKARGVMLYADAALEACQLLDKTLASCGDKTRQAAIYDAQRSASWSAMEAEVRAHQAGAAQAIEQRDTFVARYKVWKARAKRWAVYGAIGGALVGSGSVILSFAFYVAAG